MSPQGGGFSGPADAALEAVGRRRTVSPIHVGLSYRARGRVAVRHDRFDPTADRRWLVGSGAGGGTAHSPSLAFLSRVSGTTGPPNHPAQRWLRERADDVGRRRVITVWTASAAHGASRNTILLGKPGCRWEDRESRLRVDCYQGSMSAPAHSTLQSSISVFGQTWSSAARQLRPWPFAVARCRPGWGGHTAATCLPCETVQVTAGGKCTRPRTFRSTVVAKHASMPVSNGTGDGQ